CHAFREARDFAWRRGGAGGGVFHSFKAGACGGAGDAVFVLYVAAACDSFHRRTLYCRTVRRTAPKFTDDSAKRADPKTSLGTFLPAAKFWKLRRDGGGGAWPAGAWQSDTVQHSLHGVVLRDCFDRGRGDFLAEGPQMTTGRSTAWLLLPVLAAGFAGVWQLQRKVNFVRDAMREEQDEVLVRSATVMYG